MQIYVVKQGDTLFSISREFNTSVEELERLNAITAQRLVVGQALIVDPTPERIGTAFINGYAYTNINRDVLRTALPYMTSLTIFGYGFNENADLIPIDDSELISLAYEFNVVPIMLLSTITESGNFSTQHAATVMQDPSITQRLIDNVISLMNEKGYRGIDIDFEFVAPENRVDYINFIRAFAERLNPLGYTVNVDLAPKTSANQVGLLYESHDYRGIGKVANTVLAMTYEWGYTYGPAMAVAPINQVSRVLNYALTEIPPQKILMGIPNYAYDWTLPFVKGESEAVTIGNEQAIEIAFNNNAQIMFDEESQTPFFNYTSTDGTLHEVWFEDVRSITQKLKLINQFGILGGGYWNLMRPFTQNWIALNSVYNIEKIL